jgi:uncharacterized protein
VADVLPLFPLGLVLYPGVVLPLHIFEERYRLLVRELSEGPAPRRFGVVAIRAGSEVGEDEDPDLYDVGCVAELRRVQPYADGRFDIVTTGGPRFRLRDTDDTRPYLRGAVEYLPDPVGEVPPGLVTSVQQRLLEYAGLVAAARDAEAEELELPDDPAALSYLTAAALVTDLPEKQDLLAAPDVAARLRAERWLLRRESALLRAWAGWPELPETAGPFSLS